MESAINKRIAEVIKYKKMTVNSFSKMIGVPQTTLNNYILGKRKTSFELINKVANACPEIDKQWLLTGEGEMQSDSTTEPQDTMSLPLIPRDAMAGMLTGDNAAIMAYECENFIVPVFQGSDFLIRVQGDSMIPTYLSGDIVACKRIVADNIWFQWGKTYVLNTSQGALIKRIEPSDKEGFIKICSDNEQYKPFELPTTEIYGLALVTGIIRAY